MAIAQGDIGNQNRLANRRLDCQFLTTFGTGL